MEDLCNDSGVVHLGTLAVGRYDVDFFSSIPGVVAIRDVGSTRGKDSFTGTSFTRFDLGHFGVLGNKDQQGVATIRGDVGVGVFGAILFDRFGRTMGIINVTIGTTKEGGTSGIGDLTQLYVVGNVWGDLIVVDLTILGNFYCSNRKLVGGTTHASVHITSLTITRLTIQRTRVGTQDTSVDRQTFYRGLVRVQLFYRYGYVTMVKVIFARTIRCAWGGQFFRGRGPPMVVCLGGPSTKGTFRACLLTTLAVARGS